jgi:hypothetical protein
MFILWAFSHFLTTYCKDFALPLYQSEVGINYTTLFCHWYQKFKWVYNEATHKFHYQLVSQYFILHKALTCFGHISWPSSGSYKVSKYVHHTRLKTVGVLYNKYENPVQLDGSAIVSQKRYIIKYKKKLAI